jgi:hypothetical protein
MKRSNRFFVYLLAAALCAAGGAWLTAGTMDDDDRPPIIVRSGSLLFENGTAAVPGSAWSMDTILDEWKPAGSGFKSIRSFAVTFENVYGQSSCQSATLTGDAVDIEYTSGGVTGAVVKMRIHKRRSHLLGLFGRNEPKVDPEGHTLTANVASTVPQLIYTDPTGGYISKITVAGNAECVIPPPSTDAARLAFQVLIQPKAK